MAAKIVNLNKRRKATAKSDRKRRADENAVKFGRGKAQKTLEETRNDKRVTHLDAHRRDPE